MSKNKNTQKSGIKIKKRSLIPEKHSGKRNSNYIYLIIIAVITFAAFAIALQNNFLIWDDKDYVTENAYIKEFNPQALKTMFKVYVSCHYHPLTLVSLAVDYKLWGEKATGFIFTNILWHILNSLLIFILFLKISNKRDIALITALLFAIHPLRVESVVWISERKDVLFSFFYFLSLIAYTHYLKNEKKLKYFFYTFLIFVVALFSKATAVSLPLLLLLFDYYFERKNYTRLIIEKIPFFVLSVVFGLVAMDAQSAAEPNSKGLIEHIFLITYAISFYLIKFLLPFFQSAIIPFPESINGVLPLKYYLSLLIIPALLAVLYYLKANRRLLIFGLGFFFVTLIMVLLKFPIGPAYLAERYTYLPHIGLAFMVGTFYHNYAHKNRLKHNISNLFFVALLILGSFFFVKTIMRTKVWQNSITLFTDVVERNPTYAYGLSNKGQALALAGKHPEAIKEYSLALKYKPDFVDGYNNRATSHYVLQDFAKVITDLDSSIALSPNNAKIADMYNNRGLANLKLNRYNEALYDFNAAIAKSENYIDAYRNRMECYIKLREYDKALYDLDVIMPNKKSDPEYYNQKGIILAEKLDFGLSAEAFSQAISISPNNPAYYVNRGYALLNTDLNAACTDFSKGVELKNTGAAQLFNQYCK